MPTATMLIYIEKDSPMPTTTMLIYIEKGSKMPLIAKLFNLNFHPPEVVSR